MPGCTGCSLCQRDSRSNVCGWTTYSALHDHDLTNFMVSYDCNGTGAQRWVIKRGSTKVQVAGKNFCLDAGSGQCSLQHAIKPRVLMSVVAPASGVGMKIWQCYDNLAAQKWSFTEDNRIALEGKGIILTVVSCYSGSSDFLSSGQCLDLPNGVMVNSNQVQTWQCSDNNNNQVWSALTI